MSCARLEGRHIAVALGAFETTLRFGDTRFDRYVFEREKSALTPAEVHGMEIFRYRAKCEACHSIGADGALFSDQDFHNRGIGMQDPALGAAATRVHDMPIDAIARDMISIDRTVAALGRYNVTKRPQDIGKFRTPSLRNVALTAPYMHDGSIATLAEAVNHEVWVQSSELATPLILTPAEKRDLVAFLRALTSPELEASAQVANQGKNVRP